MKENALQIKLIKAGIGDCILISFSQNKGKTFNILVDGGAKYEYQYFLKKEIEELIEREEKIDLLIATHQDADHINGIVELLKELNGIGLKAGMDLVQDRIFNAILILETAGLQIGAKKAAKIEEYFFKAGLWDPNMLVLAGETRKIGEATLQFISPIQKDRDKWYKINATEWKGNFQISGKEETPPKADYWRTIQELQNLNPKRDRSVANNASIGFVFTFGNQRILFLGDASPQVVSKELEKLGASPEIPMHFDAIKLSHHGGYGNISEDLLLLVDCDTFFISTNGNNRLPRKATLAKILTSPNRKEVIRFIFNYDKETYSKIFRTSEMNEYSIECYYAGEEELGFTWINDQNLTND